MLKLQLSKKKIALFIVGILFLVLTTAPSVYFYKQYKDSQQKLANPAEAAKEEVAKIIASIGKLMVLPSDEEPTVATVADRDKLKDQLFFTNAQNGDKVVIYTKAKKAILYRPTTNKIIEVAPVNLGQANATGSAEANNPTFTTVLLNGAGITGLTKKYSTELTTKVPQLNVINQGNAKKSDYSKTILVDVSGDKGQLATQIGQILGISVGSLPNGEATPSADFLIIVGNDKQ